MSPLNPVTLTHTHKQTNKHTHTHTLAHSFTLSHPVASACKGASTEVRLRLTSATDGDCTSIVPGEAGAFGEDFDAVFADRIVEANTFYSKRLHGLTDEHNEIQRQVCFVWLPPSRSCLHPLQACTRTLTHSRTLTHAHMDASHALLSQLLRASACFVPQRPWPGCCGPSSFTTTLSRRGWRGTQSNRHLTHSEALAGTLTGCISSTVT